MIRSKLALAISLVMMLLAFSGCGGKTDEKTATATAAAQSPKAENTAANEKKISGEIQFMTYRDDLLNSWYPKVLKEFKAKYPDVKITTSTSKNFETDLKELR